MDSSTDIRRIVRVHGRVQGVGFRWATSAAAEERGVRGVVRNLVDGTVEADLEGDAEAVEAMCVWLREGPPSARVDHVEVREDAPRGARGFEIGH